jgi:hypothetical protein
MRRAGGRIRISAQCSTCSRKRRSGRDFNEELQDCSISKTSWRKVANLLMPETDRRRLQNLARGAPIARAFEAYLRGRYHLFSGDAAQFAKANYFEKPFGSMPIKRLAYTGLANTISCSSAFAPSRRSNAYS